MATYTQTQWVISIFGQKFRTQTCGRMYLTCGSMFEMPQILAANFDRQSLSSITDYFKNDKRILKIREKSLQAHHADFTLKRRGNGCFHVAPTWNSRIVFVGV